MKEELMKKIFVTGVTGQLGHDVSRVLEARGTEVLGVSSRDVDITDFAAVERALTAFRPDAVIHCAAYTAVDRAEDEPELCMAVNADGTRNLATVCRQLDIPMLYVSTDYVFPGEGEQFYATDDPVGPKNIYGKSKLAGETVVRSLLEKYYIVRTSWVFGINGGNFVKTMLRLSESREEVTVVCDQIGSPTYTGDLAPLLCDMIFSDRYGIYHAANAGVCSWAEFAAEIFRQSGKSTKVKPIPTDEYPVKASRPLNSRMSMDSLDAGGFSRLPPWQDALRRYLLEFEQGAING